MQASDLSLICALHSGQSISGMLGSSNLLQDRVKGKTFQSQETVGYTPPWRGFEWPKAAPRTPRAHAGWPVSPQAEKRSRAFQDAPEAFPRRGWQIDRSVARSEIGSILEAAAASSVGGLFQLFHFLTATQPGVYTNKCSFSRSKTSIIGLYPPFISPV